LAAAFKLPSSNLSLFLNSLVTEGWARKQGENGLYALSGKIAVLAGKVGQDGYRGLLSAAKPEMENLSRRFDENVLLAVIEGGALSFIARLQSKRSIQVVNTTAHFPPHVTAGGKAILAFLPETRRRAYLESAAMKKFTSKTILRKSALEKELSKIATQGFALNLGEYEQDVLAIGAPILSGGEAIAALVVQFPRSRVDEKGLASRALPVVEAGRRIGEIL
jgi:DNA-binding IclR family transcriptional regulator